jgi:hypothetical protein
MVADRKSSVETSFKALELRNELVVPTNDDWLQAWAAYERGEAAQAGIVDHVSFVVMRRLAIVEAFTNSQPPTFSLCSPVPATISKRLPASAEASRGSRSRASALKTSSSRTSPREVSERDRGRLPAVAARRRACRAHLLLRPSRREPTPDVRRKGICRRDEGFDSVEAAPHGRLRTMIVRYHRDENIDRAAAAGQRDRRIDVRRGMSVRYMAEPFVLFAGTLN